MVCASPANTPCFRPDKNQRRIGVKLDPNGEMTSIIHGLKIGDVVEISQPLR